MTAINPKDFLPTLSRRPGVYRMYDAAGRLLYVGKAKNLRKRVSSYFRSQPGHSKTSVMMRQVTSIETTITMTENEALLLECNLIKKLKPRYNILLKDDKSYPYILLSDHPYPRLCLHRGSQNEPGRYFGPYPNARAAYETMALMQRIFRIRPCRDSFFRARSRPCVQYQIKRCSAPCVRVVVESEYQQNVEQAEAFLSGKNSKLIQDIILKMEEAASSLQYETAALYRDQISALRRIQTHQLTSGREGDIDAMAAVEKQGLICISVLYIRGGRLLGNKNFFPTLKEKVSLEEVVSEFLPQYYLSSQRGQNRPQRVYLNTMLTDKAWICSALNECLQIKLSIVDRVRGRAKDWMKMAEVNATEALGVRLAGQGHVYRVLEGLQRSLDFSELPERIVCFDVSHTQGMCTVASCVVFGLQGALRQHYRRFNIRGIQRGDDYEAIKQVVTRYFSQLLKGNKALPDVVMIDGGRGQLAQAQAALSALGILDICLIGIAKGEGRRAEHDVLWRLDSQGSASILPDQDAFRHYLQSIRDEAHRFAITGHRAQRAKKQITSKLEQIPGIGPKRRRELLRQFGGLQEILQATIEDLMRVPGINQNLAEQIYQALKEGI